MVEAGKALVDGIWKGIKENWDSIVSNVKELGGKLVDSVKGFFKIGSPSKLFADEVGQWIPEGVAVGIEANADSVNGAVEEMVNDALVDPDVKAMKKTADAMMISSTNNGVVAVGSDNSAAQVLLEYMPLILAAIESCGTEISPDFKQFFNVMRKENNSFRKANGVSAFA